MEVFGGYRAVRRLGEGRRAEVWLGLPVTEDSHDTAGRTGVALKLYRAASGVHAGREVDGLQRVRSMHVVEPLDAASVGGQPCLVLPRLDPGGLRRLLSERVDLAVGEIVTILVSLARAVGALHDAGVTHGDIRADKVLFTDGGAPVLIGGSSIRTHERDLSVVDRRTSDAHREDRCQLASLAQNLLGRVAGDPASSTLAEWLDTDPWHAADFAPELEHRAFGCAHPIPVELPWQHGREAPTRPGAAATAAVVRRSRNDSAHQSQRGDGGSAGIAGVVTRRVLPSARRVITSLRTVRPRYRAVAVLGIVALALGTAIPPIASAGYAAGPAATSAPAPSEVTTDAEDVVPTAAVEASAERIASHTKDAVAGDDPVEAARALLGLREECLAQASLECLGGVVQADSAAWDTDSATIRRLQQGEVHTPPGWLDGELAVIDTMGAVVLLAMGPAQAEASAETPTASVLVIRTEAGWRIRDVFTD